MSYHGTKQRPILNAVQSEDFWMGIMLFGLVGGGVLGGGFITLGIIGPGGAPLFMRIICLIVGLIIAGLCAVPVTEAAKDIIEEYKNDKRRNERIAEREAEEVIEEARRAAERQVLAKKRTHRADAEEWGRQWQEALGIKPAQSPAPAPGQSLWAMIEDTRQAKMEREKLMVQDRMFMEMQDRILNQAANPDLNPWRKAER